MPGFAETLKYQFTKPAVHAGVGGFLLAQELGGDTFRIDGAIPVIGGRLVSAMTLGAGVGFASSFAVEALNNVIGAIDRKHRLKSFPSFVSHVGGSMASWYVIPQLLGFVDRQTSMTLAKTGLMSEIIAQWVHENFIEEGGFGQDLLDLI